MFALDAQGSFLLNLETLILGTGVLFLAVIVCLVRGCFRREHPTHK